MLFFLDALQVQQHSDLVVEVIALFLLLLSLYLLVLFVQVDVYLLFFVF